MKTLIVDDEEEIGLMVSKFLQKEGLESSYVDSIEKAALLISKESFDLFFLDLNLPDGTGFDLIPAIKKQKEKKKIVVISAYDGIREIERSQELGVDLFIRKPFTKQQIIDAAKTALD